jgi:sigma-B regulation protein RsbU (phosphoserine phosphatase)
MTSTSESALERKFRLLLDTSRVVGGTLDLDTILRRLLESIRSAVPYDAAGIFVLRESVPFGGPASRNVIAGMAQEGFDAQRDDDPMLGSGRGIVGHVVRTGETVVAADVSLDPRYVEGRRSTRSEIAVPIVSDGRTIGALDVESDRLATFADADVEVLEFFAGAAAVAIQRALLHREVVEKQRMDHQMAIARDVQSSLLPRVPPAIAGYDVAGVNVPTWAIGGDYYDFVPLDGGRLGLIVADVSGKGVPAALIMTTFRAAIRSELRREPRLTLALREVNRIVLESTEVSRFVSAFVGVLEPDSGRLTYVNCGHPPAIVLREDGSLESLDPTGPILGISSDWRASGEAAELRPGDTLAAFTDGVVEVADAGDVLFGPEGLERVLRDAAALPAESIVRSVLDATRTFAARSGYDDDFTLVVVKRPPVTRSKN